MDTRTRDTRRPRGPVLALAALALAAAPAARAQTVLLVTDSAAPPYRDTAAGFKKVVPDVVLVDASTADLVAQIRARAPAVVAAVGAKASAAAKDAVAGAPFVYVNVLRPAKKDLAGARITGVPMEVPASAALGRLKKLMPQVVQVGVVFDPAMSDKAVEGFRSTAEGLGLKLVVEPAKDAGEAKAAFARLMDQVQAFWFLPDSRIMTSDVVQSVVPLCVEKKIAVVGFVEQMTDAGALFSLAPDYDELGRRAGGLARDLAQKPPEERLPVPPPVYGTGILSINLRTAGSLGVTVSDEVLAVARKVVR